MAPSRRGQLMRWALQLLALARYGLPVGASMCPGSVSVEGYGQSALTNAGSNVPGQDVGSLEIGADGSVVAHMDARVYFSDSCTEGSYDHTKYLGLKLLGKTLKFTTDISGAGCGCNAALYLVSMKQNPDISSCNDYYCDANKVCGVSCAEVDIMEANKRAWHSTLHSAQDHSGKGGGFGGGDGWNGPRDFNSQQYGPGGSCIDTSMPFDVAVSFPVDAGGRLQAMKVTLTQTGKSCPLDIDLNSYTGMAEIHDALDKGMTPIISYWKSGDMLWMDGKGADGQGPCAADSQHCGASVKFSGFKLEAMPGHPPLEPAPMPAAPPVVNPQPPVVSPVATLPPLVPVASTSRTHAQLPPVTQPPVASVTQPPLLRPKAPVVSPVATLPPLVPVVSTSRTHVQLPPVTQPPLASVTQPPLLRPQPPVVSPTATESPLVPVTSTSKTQGQPPPVTHPPVAEVTKPPLFSTSRWINSIRPSVVPVEPAATPSPQPAPAAPSQQCSAKNKDCRSTRCCKEPGMQCYQKNSWWASCKETCTPGIDPTDAPEFQQPWECKPLGQRAAGSPASGKHDEVVVTVRQGLVPQNTETGAEVTITVGGKKVRGTIVSVKRGAQATTASSPGAASGNSGACSTSVWGVVSLLLTLMVLAAVGLWAWRLRAGDVAPEWLKNLPIAAPEWLKSLPSSVTTPKRGTFDRLITRSPRQQGRQSLVR